MQRLTASLDLGNGYVKANINNIIRDFANESQFIIVTHNKQTMAAVDVIYGVFMEEPGVSNVSSVDFREFEHMSILESTN